VLIVGAGEVGRRLAEDLRRQPEYGLDPMGVIDEVGVFDAELIASVEEIADTVERTRASRVILAFGRAPDLGLVDVLRTLSAKGIEVFVVPRLFELGAAAGDPFVDDVWGVPLVWLRRRVGRGSHLLSKRVFDVAVTLLTLVPALPVLVVAAVLVRCTSRGPVLFRQRRIGQHGREFNLLKFRSMRVNADSETTWNVSSDRRVTVVGRFLRRTSIDELPQLFNVLRGDMSLVGPRPERPHFVEQFGRTVPHYAHRHRAPVGLTGWAQVHGLRGDTSIEERVRFDNYYIEHWSMWRDLTVLARTARAALRGR
jgi:exopolysaccharide biosynthesis polyprenyl glycosylphosphotransferase